MEGTLKAITEIRAYIHENDLWDKPQPLSEAMTKIAVRNHELSEHIAPLEHTYKSKQLLSYKKLRENKTQGDATTESKLESLDERQAYMNAKTIHKATADLINVIQSRLKILSEQARGNQ